jgi:hypothetical protein
MFYHEGRKSTVNWEQFADSIGVTGRNREVSTALRRLENGDVSMTQYGIRVAVRHDLGDDKPEHSAYWPRHDEDTGRRKCCATCYRSWSCSHFVAASIYEEWLEKRTGANGGQR